MFHNPVIWRKSQRHEDSQINIMGNIRSPFLETERFSVEFVKTPPSYDLRLTMSGKSPAGPLGYYEALTLSACTPSRGTLALAAPGKNPNSAARAICQQAPDNTAHEMAQRRVTSLLSTSMMQAFT
jgi:hypothetical protein